MIAFHHFPDELRNQFFISPDFANPTDIVPERRA
jgi:hypothetical protein